MKNGKDLLLFFIKSFIFTIIFWISWIFILRPISVLQNQNRTSIEHLEKQQTEEYSRQINKAEIQLAVAESQQKRMDKLLSQYEQQVSRYDAVLRKWEQQTGIRK